jgi:hypothetical protein
MTALVFNQFEIDKFPIPNNNGGVWQPTNNSNKGYWLQLEAKQDLDDAGITYTIEDITIITQPNGI